MGRNQVQKKTFLACSLFPIVGHAIILQRTVSFNSSYARAYVLHTVLGIFHFLYYCMRNFCNLIGLEQWFFSLNFKPFAGSSIKK